MGREEFATLVGRSSSLTQILKEFGLLNKGGNFATLRSRMDEDKIDYSHISIGLACNKGKKFPNSPIATPLAEILIENSTFTNTHNLKRKLLRDGLIKNECAKCKIGPEWQGEKLVLVLDHINGKNRDHRLFNLRLLCPNCNSQTPTFAGRNRNISSGKIDIVTMSAASEACDEVRI